MESSVVTRMQFWWQRAQVNEEPGFRDFRHSKNLRRLNTLQWVVLLLQAPGLLVDIYNAYNGKWTDHPALLNLFLMHILHTIVLISGVMWVRACRKLSVYKANRSRVVVVMVVLNFITCLFFAINDQNIHGSLTVYILMALITAATFMFKPLFNMTLQLIMTLGLFIGLNHCVDIEYMTMYSHAINIMFTVGLSLAISMGIHESWYRLYQSKKTIRQNNIYLANMKSNLEQLLDKRSLELRETRNRLSRESVLRDQTEDELKMTRLELDHFLYRASHDMRGPVTTLRAMLNLIMRETSPDLQLLVEKTNNRLQRLDLYILNITDYLNLTRYEHEIMPVDLKELIPEMVNQIYFEPYRKKISWEIDEDLPLLVANVQVMEILLKQLIVNCFDFSPAPVGKFMCEVLVRYENGAIEIEVLDRGIGIDPNVPQEQLTQIFFRGEGSQGSGLGLFLASKAVTVLNGKMLLSNRAGGGTRVKLIFPVDPPVTEPVSSEKAVD